MIPLGDDNSGRRNIPFVTWGLIAANLLVFALLQRWGQNTAFTYAFSTVPQEILTGHDIVTSSRYAADPFSGARYQIPGLGQTPIPVYLTLLTSMFMHGGLAHILGNLLYLLVFGDNIEDRMGPARYLAFYLVTGVLAGLAHVGFSALIGGNLLVPSLGASGAVSGVLAAYALLFPRNRVRVLFFRFITRVPAAVVIGFWFLFQLINGMGLFGSGSRAGGVAYAAHIGGFISGLILTPVFIRRKARR